MIWILRMSHGYESVDYHLIKYRFAKTISVFIPAGIHQLNNTFFTFFQQAKHNSLRVVCCRFVVGLLSVCCWFVIGLLAKIRDIH